MIKTFLRDVYYDQSRGIPYFQQVLGHNPSSQYLRGQLIAQALLVPDVLQARVFFTGLVGRALTGQVQVTDKSGVWMAASF